MTTSPSAVACSSVAGDVATQVMSSRRAAEHGHQLGHRRARAQPDDHAVLDQRRRGLRRDALLCLEVSSAS